MIQFLIQFSGGVPWMVFTVKDFSPIPLAVRGLGYARGIIDG
jgi:hypothetical protein